MNKQRKEPIYAVIDTNVIVSALLSSKKDSATVKIVEKLFDKEFIPLLSEEILWEYHSVLRRKKFSFTEELIQSLIDAIENLAEKILPYPADEVLPDMKDLPFYEVVLTKNDPSAYLVTGNIKHFPQKAFVVTPREFLELLQSEKYLSI